MKKKHAAFRLIITLTIIVCIISFPYVWFKFKADEFLDNDYIANDRLFIQVHSYQDDIRVEIESAEDKAAIISALQSKLEYKGALLYRLSMQLKGEHEIYEVKIDDLNENSSDRILYIGDTPDYNYLLCGNEFNAGFHVSRELMDILKEYTDAEH